MVKLVGYDEAPAHLQHNRFIRSGYRCYLSYVECARSLFVWSNELINIWSHLAGFLWATGVLLEGHLYTFPRIEAEQGASPAHRGIITVFLVCVQVCMMTSSLYHLFNCHSPGVAHRWLKRDFMGISVGIMGCYFPGVFYGFYCFPAWQRFYMQISSVLSAVSIFIQLHPEFSTERWKLRRILTYAGTLLFGFIPLMHWTLLNRSNPEELDYFLPKALISYAFIGAGFLFYVTFWPECCSPGKFDYVGHSHQWWHFLVLGGFMWWYSTGIVMMHHRISPEGCAGVQQALAVELQAQ